MYLSYDIKGIQQFIFSVPRLRYMIGASCLISQFDEKWHAHTKDPGEPKCVFSGGGRGMFECPIEAIAELRNRLVEAAHAHGFDIRIGVAADFLTVLEQADELYPYLPGPDELSGYPCTESGLYPVKSNDESGKSRRQFRPHPLLRKRAGIAKKDPLGEGIVERISQLRTENMLPERLRSDFSIEFIRNVSPELQSNGTGQDTVSEEELQEDIEAACAGQASLGKRNRWAIIAMDGNAIGKHFKEIVDNANDPANAISQVSQSLKQITQTAFDDAVVAVLTDWFSDNIDSDSFDECCYNNSLVSQRRLVVPIRPILVGGDDVILLCHPSHAMTFVTEMAKRFEEESERDGERLKAAVGFNPWRSGGNRLTISAGVLFAKTSLPLHVAIPYAESLLANAKSAFRGNEVSGEPVPSSIDWETITDTMLEHPAIRRKRTLQLLDNDLGVELMLTRRPYRLDAASGPQASSFPRLHTKVMQAVTLLPASIRHDLAEALCQPWAVRTQFLCALSKSPLYRKEPLFRQLVEGLQLDPGATDSHVARWADVSELDQAGKRKGKRILATDVIDAITLIDEGQRHTIQTAREV